MPGNDRIIQLDYQSTSKEGSIRRWRRCVSIAVIGGLIGLVSAWSGYEPLLRFLFSDAQLTFHSIDTAFSHFVSFVANGVIVGILLGLLTAILAGHRARLSLWVVAGLNIFIFAIPFVVLCMLTRSSTANLQSITGATFRSGGLIISIDQLPMTRFFVLALLPVSVVDGLIGVILWRRCYCRVADARSCGNSGF